MVFALLPLRRLRARLAALGLCAVVFGAWGLVAAKAQTQEGGTLDRITHPDRTLAFTGADKSFAVSSSVAGRQATVKPFAFSHGATLKAGDGGFSTRAFTPKDHFQTESYTARKAAVLQKGFVATDKSFSTKSAPVNEDRAANKAMSVREYAPFEKEYLGRGKRQDTIDDLRKQKNLTIDEVREILNKNK